LKIGRQDYIDIVAKNSEDRIYVLTGGEGTIEQAESYPTVWDFLAEELD
jgi:hypothetical protein